MFPHGRWSRRRRTGASRATAVVGVLAFASATAAVVLVFAVVLTGCASGTLTDTTHVTVGGHELTVEVADSLAEQSRGMTGRRTPDDGEGMLFVWDDYGPRAFTISTVSYDLDVIFIDEDGRVSEILPLSPDGPTDAQGSYPARYVLEVRGGWAERQGVEPGDEFSIEGGS